MSIINKMLQDLDVRNGRAGGEALGGGAIRSVKPESRWKLGRNAVILIGLLVVALAAAWWLQQRDAAAVAARAAMPAKPAAPVAATAAPLAPITGAAPAAPAVAAAPVVAPVAVAPVASAAAQAPPTVLAQVAASPPKAQPTPVLPAVPMQTAGTPQAVRPPAPAAPQPATQAAPRPLAFANASGEAVKPASPAPPPAKPTVASAKPAAGKTYSTGQQAANWLAEAVALDQQGRHEEAKAPLQRSLAANPLDVPARRMLAQMLLDTHQAEAARTLLAEGQKLLPEQTEFGLTLARLKADSGDIKGAIQAMEAVQTATRDEPQARALLAALLLRDERYDDAVKHYLVALRSDPANTSWLVGVGVALEGVGKPADAAQAYRRASDATTLTPEVAHFLSDRLTRLGR